MLSTLRVSVIVYPVTSVFVVVGLVAAHKSVAAVASLIFAVDSNGDCMSSTVLAISTGVFPTRANQAH